MTDIGILPDTLKSLSGEALTAIDNEEDEDTLLVTTIKNQTKDKKASRDQNIEYDSLDLHPPSPSSSKLKIKKSFDFKMRNTTQGFGNKAMDRSASRESNDPMRESTMYFLK